MGSLLPCLKKSRENTAYIINSYRRTNCKKLVLLDIRCNSNWRTFCWKVKYNFHRATGGTQTLRDTSCDMHVSGCLHFFYVPQRLISYFRTSYKPATAKCVYDCSQERWYLLSPVVTSAKPEWQILRFFQYMSQAILQILRKCSFLKLCCLLCSGMRTLYLFPSKNKNVACSGVLTLSIVPDVKV